MLYSHPKADRGRRETTFGWMVDHVRGAGRLDPVIVETGTCANLSDHIGAGNSTELWNEFVVSMTGLMAISIDIDPSAIKLAQFKFRHVRFICGDAAEVLRHMPAEIVDRIALLYLDSLWDPTGGQALRELEAIWSRLPSGCMVAIDDRHSDEIGKHVASEAFLRELGLEPVFKDYQIGWVKP